jgi:hypothetical protein
MQQTGFKIVGFFFSLAFLVSQPALAQDSSQAFVRADSLFAAHQYTEALALYEHVLLQNDQYTPSMLLKMAFIQEGRGDFTGAMYYLHLYYAKHPSRSVLRKMEELAQANGLVGYEYNDLKFFSTQFQKHYMKLLELMMIVAVMTVTLLLLRRWKGRKVSFAALGAYMGFLLFILFYLNILSLGEEGIIRKDQVPVMSAPSAGATWLATASQGHKVNIIGEQDIWYRIKWDGATAYIRKNNILPLP